MAVKILVKTELIKMKMENRHASPVQRDITAILILLNQPNVMKEIFVRAALQA